MSAPSPTHDLMELACDGTDAPVAPTWTLGSDTKRLDAVRRVFGFVFSDADMAAAVAPPTVTTERSTAAWRGALRRGAAERSWQQHQADPRGVLVPRTRTRLPIVLADALRRNDAKMVAACGPIPPTMAAAVVAFAANWQSWEALEAARGATIDGTAWDRAAWTWTIETATNQDVCSRPHLAVRAARWAASDPNPYDALKALVARHLAPIFLIHRWLEMGTDLADALLDLYEAAIDHQSAHRMTPSFFEPETRQLCPGPRFAPKSLSDLHELGLLILARAAQPALERFSLGLGHLMFQRPLLTCALNNFMGYGSGTCLTSSDWIRLQMRLVRHPGAFPTNLLTPTPVTRSPKHRPEDQPVLTSIAHGWAARGRFLSFSDAEPQRRPTGPVGLASPSPAPAHPHLWTTQAQTAMATALDDDTTAIAALNESRWWYSSDRIAALSAWMGATEERYQWTTRRLKEPTDAPAWTTVGHIAVDVRASHRWPWARASMRCLVPFLTAPNSEGRSAVEALPNGAERAFLEHLLLQDSLSQNRATTSGVSQTSAHRSERTPARRRM